LNLSAGQQRENANNESMVKWDKKQIRLKLVELPSKAAGQGCRAGCCWTRLPGLPV
jgi:hypothetical protein